MWLHSFGCTLAKQRWFTCSCNVVFRLLRVPASCAVNADFDGCRFQNMQCIRHVVSRHLIKAARRCALTTAAYSSTPKGAAECWDMKRRGTQTLQQHSTF